MHTIAMQWEHQMNAITRRVLYHVATIAHFVYVALIKCGYLCATARPIHNYCMCFAWLWWNRDALILIQIEFQRIRRDAQCRSAASCHCWEVLRVRLRKKMLVILSISVLIECRLVIGLWRRLSLAKWLHQSDANFCEEISYFPLGIEDYSCILCA